MFGIPSKMKLSKRLFPVGTQENFHLLYFATESPDDHVMA
jgi:hypothetical protein